MYLKFFIRVLITLCALIWIVNTMNWRMFFNNLSSIRWKYFLLILILGGFRYSFSVNRWKLFIDGNISFFILLKLYLIGTFFNMFLPTNVGGDVIKGAFLKNYIDMSTTKGILTSAIERISGLIALIILAWIGCLIKFDDAKRIGILTPLIVISAIIILLITCIVIFNKYKIINRLYLSNNLKKRINDVLKLIDDIIGRVLSNGKLTIKLTMFAFLIQLSDNVIFYFFSLVSGSNVNILNVLLIYPIIVFISMLPISLNGIGITEGTAVYLLSALGMSNETSLLTALLYRVYLVTISIVGGIFWLFINNGKNCINKKY